MIYSDKLPRRVKGNVRCQHLDENGNRCKKKALIEETVHEDPELSKVRWVTVCFCSIHVRCSVEDLK